MNEIFQSDGEFEVIQNGESIYKRGFYTDDKGIIKDNKTNKELFNIEKYPLKAKNMRNLNKDEEESYIKGLEKISTPTGYRVFEDNINYDELLDKWFELVMKESDRVRQLSDEEYYKKPYSFKQGHLKGFADGLIMATSILSNLERKVKKEK